MLCDIVRRRCWAHAPVIHAASHFDYKKRVAWVPISMHTCGSFFYNYGAPLGGLNRSSAIILSKVKVKFLYHEPSGPSRVLLHLGRERYCESQVSCPKRHLLSLARV